MERSPSPRPSHRRVLGAALVGALIIFAWGGLSHMLLLKGVGFRHLAEEAPLIAAMQRTLPGAGLYFFPSLDLASHEERELRAWESRFQRGPTGMILFRPAGGAPLSSSKLAWQFASELLAAVLLAYLLSWLAAPPLVRALAPAGMGAFACLSVSALYWNWYGFPTSFFLAQCADKVIGWALAGMALARMTRAAAAASRR